MKKTLSLILALLMVLALFAGCANDEGKDTPTSTPSSTPASSSEQPSEEPGLVYPKLTEDPVTLTVWQTFSSTYITSMNDSYFVDYLEEATNVRLDFKEATGADATTVFNLMINSGDFTDIVRPGDNQYPGGPDKAVEDGIYLDLKDLIEEYAPHYQALRNNNADLYRQTVTDAGNMWSMYTVNDPAEYPWMGLALRSDLLEKNNVALPVTLADWETALQVYLDEGIKYPLLFDITGVSFNSEFLSAFQIGKEFYQKDGKVEFGYTQPEFKEYLTLMNDWYKRGYIDPEFTSHGVNFAIFGGDAFAFLMNGEAAAALLPWGFTASAKAIDGSTLIEDFYLHAVQAPKMNAGDTVRFRYTSYEAKVPNAITSACADPVLAVRLIDYLCSEEGSNLINFGKEGISYTMVDGKPRYTDLILHSDTGFLPRDVAYKYAWDDGAGLSDFKRLWQTYEGTPSEAALDAYNIWNTDSNEYLLPPITRTAAEGDEFSALFGDIKTFCTEKIPAFITGAKPLSDFEDFVAQIESMDIARCLEIQQDALDRYLAR